MEYIRLKDVSEITMGQSPESSSYNTEGGGLPFFQGNADFGELYPTERVWCNAPQKIAEPGDILISVRAPIGALNYAKKRCCIGRGLASIRIDNLAERNYVFHLLKARNQELNQKGTGSTFKAISKKVLEEFMVPVVSEDEQKTSMELMDLTETIIRSRRKELSALDKLIKARFVEMFGDPEYNSKKWLSYKLGELCEVGSSKRIYQNEQSTEGVPFWRISDLVSKMDMGNAQSSLFIPESRYNELIQQGLVPESGDILVTSRGTLGRCYIIKSNDKFYFQDGMISWLSKFKNNVTPIYIQYLFEQKGFRKQLDNNQVGSTVAYLSISMLKKLNVMLPPVELQNQFATFVCQVDKSKTAVQVALDETQLLFDSLMQQYFG